MKKLNLLPLFLMLSLLLIGNLPSVYATVIYNGFVWQNDVCTNVEAQNQISGSYPDMQAAFVFRPQSDTICLTIDKGVDCFTDTTEPCWYEGTFSLDYDLFSYVVITSASFNDNTTIISEQFGNGENGLAFNTSFTHVANNQALLTWDWASGAYRSFHYGTSVLGQTVPCEGYFNINENANYDFIMQMRNTTTIDVWLGNSTYPFERWCSFTDLTGGFVGYDNGGMDIGYRNDDGPGAGGGNMVLFVTGIVQGFGCIGAPVHTVQASIINLDCDAPAGAPPIEEQEGEPPGVPIEAPPNVFGVGNQSSFIFLTVEDDRGNFRSQYALGESMIFDASLQFINDTSGLVQDAPNGLIINFFRFDEFFNDFTLIGSQPTIDRGTGLGPRARLPYIHIDGLIPTTDFVANYSGSFAHNLTATISNIQIIITIEDFEIPLSIGTRLSPPKIEGTRTGTIQEPLDASNIRPQNIFSHLEPFRVSTFLTRSDTGATLAQQRVFLQMDINATGNWVAFQTLETNSVGRASSEFRIWDTRFIGEQRFRFIYFASAPFANTTSVNATAFVASTSLDFRLTIELIPSTVFPGDRVEIRGQLMNIGNNQFGSPMPNERIVIFVSSFDKTAFFDLQVTSSSRVIIRTDTNGLYSYVIFGPNIGGASSQTMNFFANSSINSVVATSANITLTINERSIVIPQELGEVQPINFLLFSFLIDNPKANCQFSEPKTCSTISWMTIVFIVSSVLAMVSFGLKLPGQIIGIGWIFMMLGGLIMGVAVGAVLELLLFIGALPVIVILIMSIGSIIRMKGVSGGVETA